MRVRSVRVAVAVVLAGAALSVVPLVPVRALADPTPSAGPGADAPYYRTTLLSIAPAVPGVTVSVTPSGDWIRVTNTTSTPLLVLGYNDEPYLRLGPGGVDENTSSMSAFLNGTLYVSQLPPDWTARPVHWVHRSDTPTYAWHDHRVHWMSASRPPPVAADPQAPHRVWNWTVQLRYGSTPVVVTGTLDWLGRPGPLSGLLSKLLWALAVLVPLAGAGYAVRAARRRSSASQEVPAEPPPDQQGAEPAVPGDHQPAEQPAEGGQS